MFGKLRSMLAPLALAAMVATTAQAQESGWRVSRSSGDVTFTTAGAQPVALASNAVLRAGDTVRTGPNGRVLLVRGSESMLVGANAVVGIADEQNSGKSTTLRQQAGTVLLEVEKRNVQHFEVATPYLAAVVKGTKFQVTVTATGSHVEVLQGQVQVSDHKSGQYVLVGAEQAARVSAQTPGVSVSGRGSLPAIQQGTPRVPSVMPIAMPTVAAANAPAAQPAPQGSGPSDSGARSSDGVVADFVKWVRGMVGMNGRSNRDDPTAVIALTAFVGLFVAAGAAALRRRKKNDR